MTRTGPTPESRAFSLLEVMIVISILGIVMAFTTIALNSAGTETSISTSEGALQMNANDFAMRLGRELRSASRTAGGGVRVESQSIGTSGFGTNSIIRFRVPVDVDQDGSIDLDADGKAVFGATSGRTHVANVDIVYRFAANEANDSYVEASLGFDISGDNQTRGTFERGHFQRKMDDGADPWHRVSDRWFLIGDEDGDGIEGDGECPFEKDGETILIYLKAAEILERQEVSVRASVETRALPLNP